MWWLWLLWSWLLLLRIEDGFLLRDKNKRLNRNRQTKITLGIGHEKNEKVKSGINIREANKRKMSMGYWNIRVMMGETRILNEIILAFLTWKSEKINRQTREEIHLMSEIPLRDRDVKSWKKDGQTRIRCWRWKEREFITSLKREDRREKRGSQRNR